MRGIEPDHLRQGDHRLRPVRREAALARRRRRPRPRELFFALGLDDIPTAAERLRSCYQQSGGTDGFVSFECTPDLADDTRATR